MEVGVGVFCSITLSYALSLSALPYVKAGHGEKQTSLVKSLAMVLGSTGNGLCSMWDLRVEERQHPP